MEFHRVISGRTPVADGPARRYWGPFRALCADNNDPEQIGRIRVECPLVYGPGPHNRSPWAWPKNQVMAGGHRRRIDRATVEVTGDMGSFMIPEEGSPVWVEFENGDPQYPVYSTGHWGGSADGSAGTPPIHPAQTPEESKRTCPEQYPCFGDEPRTCLDCEDALEHAARAYDDVEHGKFHSHASGVFYCPRMRTIAKTETGHSILANDKDGRDHGVRRSTSVRSRAAYCRLWWGMERHGSMKETSPRDADHGPQNRMVNTMRPPRQIPEGAEIIAAIPSGHRRRPDDC